MIKRAGHQLRVVIQEQHEVGVGHLDTDATATSAPEVALRAPQLGVVARLTYGGGRLGRSGGRVVVDHQSARPRPVVL